jgi:hypothetical protein
LEIRLCNAGSRKYRKADVAPGDCVNLCAWDRGVYSARVVRVDARGLEVVGERLGAVPERGRFSFAHEDLCYLEVRERC